MNRMPSIGAGLLLSALAMAAFVLVGRMSAAPVTALAQIPDSGAQFHQMIQELKAANDKLAQIARLLREIRDRNDAAAPRPQGERHEPPPAEPARP